MNENDWHNAINHAEYKGELKGLEKGLEKGRLETVRIFKSLGVDVRDNIQSHGSFGSGSSRSIGEANFAQRSSY